MSINPDNAADKSLPALFVGHGAPDLAIHDIPAHHFLIALGRSLPRPKAVLAISAHWETTEPTISTAARPETIYDFGGFDPALRDIRYPAPGAPDLAQRIGALIPELQFDSTRGLDHGAWVPLHLMYPQADIPVTQLSVQTNNDAAHHYALGQKLRPLREEGVLILATGGIVHNLRAMSPEGSPAPEWAVSFDNWVHDKITTGNIEDLFDYRRHEYGAKSHPTPEHLMPLFVALGAGDNAPNPTTRQRLHHSFSYGSISMSAYSFGE